MIEKYKGLESRLEEQSAALKEHEGCTSRITQLEGQVKEHQSCGDKMHELKTEHLQCTGKITNLENEVKTLQDYKKKFEDEFSKSIKLQKIHDSLQSELNLAKKSAQAKEEQHAVDVRMSGFLAVQMYLAQFCPEHDIDIPAAYGRDRLPPGMEDAPAAAENKGNMDDTVLVNNGSDSEEESEGGEDENAEDVVSEDGEGLNPDSENFHQDGGRDANVDDGQNSSENQDQSADQTAKGKGAITAEDGNKDDNTFIKDLHMAVDNSQKTS